MTQTQYVAFLRGINVGGNNIIKMADLKACFEDNGFGNVSTYIQNGNVLFQANENDTARFTVFIIERTYQLIDMGPEGGSKGGKVMFEGTPKDFLSAKHSLTSAYLQQ